MQLLIRIGGAVILLALAACGGKSGAGLGAPTPSPSASADSYAGWLTYVSPWEGATFRYPPDWAVKETSVPTDDKDKAGQELRLTAPNGYRVTWAAPLGQIGGGCDASKQPHIFINRIIAMPAVGSKNPLSVVLASVKHHKALAVVDGTYVRVRTGDTGECLVYPVFESKRHTDWNLLQFMAGAAVELEPGMPSNGSEGLTDDEYLELPHVKAALLIFRSLRY